MPGLSSPIAPPFRRRRQRTTSAFVVPIPGLPNVPDMPSPAHTATMLYTVLSWVAAGATKFNIYFGTVPVPPLIITNYVGTSYVPTVVPATTFYWQIVALNDGGQAAGPIWYFTTPKATDVLVTLGGSQTGHIRADTLQIRDALNAQPNTAVFDLNTGTTSPQRAEVKIGLGSLDIGNLLFGGTIQTIGETYQGRLTNITWPAAAVDHTFTLNRHRPFGTFVNVPASTVALTLAAQYAPDFTTNHVQANLPAVTRNFDGSQDFMGCFAALATDIGGYSDVDYGKDLHLFLTEPTDGPDPLDATHPPLNDPPIQITTDYGQVRTIVFGKGHGENVPGDVAAGETLIPIPDASQFTPSGGQAIAGTTADGAQTQILTYVGVQLGLLASLVGPGIIPIAAPAAIPVSGSGIANGTYQYAYTFVTASGETTPSPLKTIVLTGVLDPPGNIPVKTSTTGGSLDVQSWYSYFATFVTADGETTTGTDSNIGFTGFSGDNAIQLSGIPVSSDSSVTARKIYRSDGWLAPPFTSADAFNGPHKLCTTINDNTTTSFLDTIADGSLGAAPPSSNTTIAHRVTLSAIVAGPTGVTARKLYRTVASGSQLKLDTTINDNSTTTFIDATADAGLGANVPTTDTSGLTQTGQVNAGATSIPTPNATPFQANGGWVIGPSSQLIRYTGISVNTLTGIPVSGIGAVVTTMPYGASIQAAPVLIGVNANNGLRLAMAKGSSVNIWVKRADLAAQAQLAAVEGGGDGIREHLIVDERRSEASLTALCDADLAQFSRPIVTVTYATHDRKTRSGKVINVNLQGYASVSGLRRGGLAGVTLIPQPLGQQQTLSFVGSFVIQDVAISIETPGSLPRYAVTASSVKFSFEDMLRRVLVG